jgi:hypothetical protein
MFFIAKALEYLYTSGDCPIFLVEWSSVILLVGSAFPLIPVLKLILTSSSALAPGSFLNSSLALSFPPFLPALFIALTYS